jgi:hypothetical protein
MEERHKGNKATRQQGTKRQQGIKAIKPERQRENEATKTQRVKKT